MINIIWWGVVWGMVGYSLQSFVHDPHSTIIIPRNISLIFSRNSEASVSEFLENLGRNLLCYYIHSDAMCIYANKWLNLWLHNSMLPVVKE